MLSLAGLPDRPSPDLDPLLDAATACFSRHGVTRTRVPDIAAEMGVSRVTIYRQAGNVSQIAALLIARDLQRLLDSIPPVDLDAVGPDAVVAIVAGLVREAGAHPVLRKVLADEPEVMGPLLTTELPEIVDRATTVLAPFLSLVFSDADRDGDAAVIAAWLVRVGITLLVAPVEDLETFLARIIDPMFGPRR